MAQCLPQLFRQFNSLSDGSEKASDSAQTMTVSSQDDSAEDSSRTDSSTYPHNKLSSVYRIPAMLRA